MRRPILVTAALAVAVLAGGCAGGIDDAGGPVDGSPAPVTTTAPPETSAAPTQAATTEPPTAAPTTQPPTTRPTATRPPATRPPTTKPPASKPPAVDTSLRKGDSGAQVQALQRRLIELGYWIPGADGEYGDGTHHAVVALQKAAGLGRDGVTGPKTRAALAEGVRPQARATKGHVIEVDLSEQLLMVVDDGRITRILDTSTGSGVTYTAPSGSRNTANTPTGTFETSWQVNGWREGDLGRLYRPKYFHPRGIAVHGYPSVPSYPASHGCVRVTMRAMDALWSDNLVPIGTTVLVHR